MSEVRRHAAVPVTTQAILVAMLVLSVWRSEPPGQEYTLAQGDDVLFWIADEMPPRYGTCCKLWGYHPVILCDGRTYSFQGVSWSHGGK